jgi:hypothetical protein
MYRCKAEVRHLVMSRVSAEVAWRTVRRVGRRRLIVPSSCIPFFQPKCLNTQATPLLPVHAGLLGRGEELVGWGMDSRHRLGMECHRNSTACFLLPTFSATPVSVLQSCQNSDCFSFPRILGHGGSRGFTERLFIDDHQQGVQRARPICLFLRS